MDPASVFRAPLETADLVIAPELYVAEVCSAFAKYVRARLMSHDQSADLVERALALVDDLQPMRDLVPDMLALSRRSQSSVYDLFYLALAKQTGAILLTADIALHHAAERAGVEVRG